ncbi:hypothetical protein GCK32_017006, partial [Trichostrongylus colubriformis]
MEQIVYIVSSKQDFTEPFTIGVKDIHTCLEVTVYDEDPNNKFEFLGKVSIPLLSIKNCERRWYALKNKKLTARARGEILLELDVIWNPNPNNTDKPLNPPPKPITRTTSRDSINKFTKKLRNPHYIDNNELLDYLSRVPCDKEL